MSAEAKHEATPWAVEYEPSESSSIWIRSEKNSSIASITVCDYGDGEVLTEEDFANAAFIVRACNSFDALTEANARQRLALEAIKAKCAAPALESDQRDAVHFAYNTADAALKSTGAK